MPEDGPFRPQLPRNCSCGLGKRAGGAATDVKVSCPNEMALVVPVSVEGRARCALIDSGCSAVLVKASAVKSKRVLADG